MRLGAIVLLLSFVAGCGGPDGSSLPVVEVVLGEGATALTIKAEVATTPAQRAHGLMGRRSLGAAEGMLFVFPEAVESGFYMKDTLIPLDIAFIGRGMVLKILSMEPCKVATCPVTYPLLSYEQALEVATGMFARAGIVAGARVQIRGSFPSPG